MKLPYSNAARMMIVVRVTIKLSSILFFRDMDMNSGIERASLDKYIVYILAVVSKIIWRRDRARFLRPINYLSACVYL
jgi:hypothetical protein